MPSRTLPGAALALLLLTSVAGCFTYQPVTGVAPVGVSVDAVLSDTGTLRLAPTIGPNAGGLRGTVRAVRADTMDIDLTEVRTRAGQSYFLTGTTVSLLRGDLAELRVRSLDRRRTTVVAISTVVGAVALAAGAKAIGGGGGTDGTGGGPPAMRPPP